MLVGGCTLGGLSPVDENDDNPSGSDTGGGTDGDTGIAGTFDPYVGLEASSGCEDFDGTPYTGATGFFIGEFNYADGVLTGVEDWLLFPNSTWEAASEPGYDCFLRWDAFGTVREGTSCVGCSHEVSIDLTFDGETSNCPQELENSEGNDGNVTYYIQAMPDGTARYEFVDGTFLADGVFGSGRSAYVSPASCKVF